MLSEIHQGFVLGVQPMMGRKSVVGLLTPDTGRREGVWFREDGRRGNMGLVQPFTLIRFELRGKQHQSLRRIYAPSLIDQVFDLGARYQGLCLLQHWIFLLQRALPLEEPEPEVFRLVSHVLAHCRYHFKPAQLRRTNLYFEAWLLHFCGLLPRIKADDKLSYHAVGGRLMLNDQTLAEGIPALKDPDPNLFSAIFHSKIEEFDSDALQYMSLTRVSDWLQALWRQHLAVQIPTRFSLETALKEHGRQ